MDIVCRLVHKGSQLRLVRRVEEEMSEACCFTQLVSTMLKLDRVTNYERGKWLVGGRRWVTIV